MRGHPTDNPLIKDEPKKHFNRNSFIFVVGGTTGPGKALIEQMLHKVRLNVKLRQPSVDRRLDFL